MAGSGGSAGSGEMGGAGGVAGTGGADCSTVCTAKADECGFDPAQCSTACQQLSQSQVDCLASSACADLVACVQSGTGGGGSGGSGGSAGQLGWVSDGCKAGSWPARLASIDTQIYDEDGWHAWAVDDSGLYLGDPPTQSVLKLDLPCGSLTPIATGQIDVTSIATDASHVYFIAGQGIGARVYRMAKSGGPPTQIAGEGGIWLTQANGLLFWLGSSGLRRAPVSGGGAVSLTSLTGFPYCCSPEPRSLAVTAQYAYLRLAPVGPGSDTEVQRVPIQGGSTATVLGMPAHMAANASQLFVTRSTGYSASELVALADTSASTTTLHSGSGSYGAVAADAAHVYFHRSHQGSVSIERVPVGGGGAQTLVSCCSVPPSILELALNSTHVYWLTRPSSSELEIWAHPK